jgi:predicted permease
MLLKNPTFTAIAALSLALGIGANTTVFSWMKGILFRPVPGAVASDRLVVVAGRSVSGSHTSLSYPDYVDLRDSSEAFSGLIAFELSPMSMSDGREARRVYGSLVSGNYFDTLGVRAALGRTFTADEDKTPNAHPVAVISHGLWQRAFGSDQNIAGKTVSLNNHPFTIIGVAPEEFVGTFVGLSIDLWVPVMMQELVLAGGSRINERGSRWLLSMGRLKDGVSINQAGASIDNITRRLAEQYPRTNEGRSAELFPLWKSPWGAGMFLRPVLFVLFAVVSLVLLIACANVANLCLARAFARRKEIAIRLSMGASRARLVRQLLTESILLAILGGVGGLFIAYWSTGLFSAFVPAVDLPVKFSVEVDSAALAFTLLISIATGIMFGLAPALQASKPDLIAALKEDTAKSSGGRGRARLRGALVVAQVALSLLLLISAGLFLKSLGRAQTVDPGFDPKGVLLASMDLFANGYTTEGGKAFQRQLIERVSALPGVESVSFARRVPLGLGGTSSSTFAIEGYEPRPGEEINVAYNNVSPGYFRTMRIPMLSGRDFAAEDNDQSQKVVVINETMAKRYWRGEDPVGRVMRRGKDSFVVAGVARDIKYNTLGEEPQPYLYFPLLQDYRPDVTLQVRTIAGPVALVDGVRQTVGAMDERLPLFDVKTLGEHISMSTIPQRIAAMMLGLFGALALALASVGLYGVMAHAVNQRTQEIGIRMALGASYGNVLALVLGQGMKLALVGVGVGLAAAFALTRLLASILIGVSATDFLTFAATSLLLVGVALAACFIPARRAARLDPMIALRRE